MKRIDKIYAYLHENTQKLSREDLLGDKGFETGEMADRLDILRNNVSKELQELLRADKIIKIKGRPVKFLDKSALEAVLQIKIGECCVEVDSVAQLLAEKEDEDPFRNIIGAEMSLKNQVEQAKAAILYPPVGLNTLIFGQTGVGKTLFAKMMYNYGKHVGKFTDDTPFITFNCADYYNNPQLLLAHIFGHSKGSFTGAEQEKEGLIEKANEGILFLDEIHRLPPEGQEMIFYFMDTGSYNKLGETERKRKASVLIIGATTEDPGSYMLKTFMRRIPINISIPSLTERTIQEKIDIIKHLFVNEAHRVNKTIKISGEVVKALIGSVSYGNIGQLKSNIQLTCAKGFLNSINKRSECIELDFKTLSSDIKSGLFEIGRNHKEFAELDHILAAPLLVSPERYKAIIEETEEVPINLYKLIEDRISLLREEGMPDSGINQFIIAELNGKLKKFYTTFNKGNKDRNRISKIIDKEILDFAEQMKTLAETELARKYSDRFIYALSFHLSLFFKRLKEEKYDAKGCISSLADSDAELKVALKIKEIMSETFQVEVPEAEVAYIAILLKSVDEEKEDPVGIIVAAHGSSTASSMVSLVRELLGDGMPICAVDMPLHVSPKEILEVIIEKVKIMDKGSGVLLLVDMGSLYKFEATIIEKTGSNVRTIDMVSTPLVLEAVRKSSVFDMELEEIYQSLRAFKGYNNEASEKNDGNKAIVTVCTSGKGTALKLKEIVENVVRTLTTETIQVFPLEISELDKKVRVLQEKYEVLAVVGVKKAKVNIPFIPLERLIDGNGEAVLREIIKGRQLEILPQQESVVIKDLCEENLAQFLTFLNPHKIIGLLLNFVETLQRELKAEFDNAVKIRIVVHMGYALERSVIGEDLKCETEKEPVDAEIKRAVDKTCELFKAALNIALTEDEKYYVGKMLMPEEN
ncbi:sigma-54-dependent transcriptional regulator [Azotosporobacter soli]|uniref:sigma-54-dependent transcriptional regulator n=1 Tax=Azotosporobacter soli TaxID=3055040 RepID=UPI0031FE7410